ncbi:MAG: DUF1559 domain-containing protein [Gemmataceae bacterium]|nr:DUF1559 domain-containing protein [Gemmataceae bacterium]
MILHDPRFPYPRAGWLTQLLPYVEQEPLARLTREAYQATPASFSNPPHVGLATPVKLFVCPADGRVYAPRKAQRTGHTVALTNYLGVSGRDLSANDGVLYRDSAVRFADIADGTSNTLLAGERPPSPDFLFGWWYAGAGQAFTGSGDSVLGARETNILSPAISPCPAGAYDYRAGSPGDPCDKFHFWSLHPGGALFLFADGSVRFIPYASATILPALASRAGGEAVSSE